MNKPELLQVSAILEEMDLSGKYFPAIEPDLIAIFNEKDFQICSAHQGIFFGKGGRLRNIIGVFDFKHFVFNVFGEDNLFIVYELHKRLSEFFRQEKGTMVLIGEERLYETLCPLCPRKKDNECAIGKKDWD